MRKSYVRIFLFFTTVFFFESIALSQVNQIGEIHQAALAQAGKVAPINSQEKNIFYDNLHLNKGNVYISNNEIGDNITIVNDSVKSKRITDFEFIYFSALSPFNNDQYGTLKLYTSENKTELIYESANFKLKSGYIHVKISNLDISLSADITSLLWSVKFEGLDSIEKAGVCLNSTPIIGNSENYLSVKSQKNVFEKIKHGDLNNLTARITGVYKKPQVLVKNNNVFYGQDLNIHFKDGTGNKFDWIGIYEAKTIPGSIAPIFWKHVSDITNTIQRESKFTDGVIHFTNTLPVGEYKAIYFLNESFDQVASINFHVKRNYELLIEKNNYLKGESVNFTFSNTESLTDGRISLYKSNEINFTNSNTLDWKFLNGSKDDNSNTSNGSVVFNSLPPGDYNAVLSGNKFSDIYKVIRFTVANIKEWTIMVYAHADHNLTPALIEDLLEMEQAGSDVNVNIVVQADIDTNNRFTKLWDSKHKIKDGFFDGVTRFLIEEDKDDNPLTFNSEILENLPEERYMDDPVQLEEFVNWSISEFPAERYGLVLWNHGAQFVGFGGDTNNGTLKHGKGLTSKEIRNSLLNSFILNKIEKFDFIGFDTCLMGGVEVIADFQGLCDIYFGCAELDYGDGWDYENVFKIIKLDPDIEILEFAKKEVEIWGGHHNAIPMDISHKVHAAYDMNKLGNFLQSFEVFANELYIYLNNNGSLIPRLRSDAIHYSIPSKSMVKSPTNYIDLGDFLINLEQSIELKNESLANSAFELNNTISEMVIAKSLGTQRQNSSGLSIAFPHNQKDWKKRFYDKYRNLNFTSSYGKKYFEALEKYSELRNADLKGPEFIVLGDSAENANIGRNQSNVDKKYLSVDINNPAVFEISITEDDAYELSANLILPNDDNSNYDYIGQVGLFRVHEKGNYKLIWPGVNPMISGKGINEWYDLGAWYVSNESKQMVSFADYLPPDSNERIHLLIFTKFDDQGLGGIQAILEDSGENLSNDNLIGATPASSSLVLEEGGKLWPVYYAETWDSKSERWEYNEYYYEEQFITISKNGLSDIYIQNNPAIPGEYLLEIQITDYFGNNSGFLDYNIVIESEPEVADESLFVTNFELTRIIDDSKPILKIGRYINLFDVNDEDFEIDFVNYVYLYWEDTGAYRLQRSNGTLLDWIDVSQEEYLIDGDTKTFWDKGNVKNSYFRLIK